VSRSPQQREEDRAIMRDRLLCEVAVALAQILPMTITPNSTPGEASNALRLVNGLTDQAIALLKATHEEGR
jgi:hypothetical protein